MSTLWQRLKPSFVDRRVPAGGDVFARAEERVHQQPVPRRTIWQRHDPSVLNHTIHELLARGEATRDPEVLLAALVLQAPRAVMAQKKMDKHPHGFHDKAARLDELITFNDTYVTTILSLDRHDLTVANDAIKRLMDRFCRTLHVPCFSNEQWEAITHGLSREIAVYLAARQLGYKAEMTSRRQDAMGVDMVITDPAGEHTINVDIKTRSSFHFRLKDLASEGRISEMQREAGEHAGFCMVINGHGDEAVHTTLLRIDEETYGHVIDFQLERPHILGDTLATIMRY